MNPSPAAALAAPPPLPGPPRRALGLPMAREARLDLPGLLARLRAGHPEICATRILHETVVDLFDPGLARRLLVDASASGQRWSRIPEVLASVHGPGSLLAAEGAQWHRLHQALAPLFAPRALAGLGDAVARLTAQALRQALDTAAAVGGAVDIDALFSRLTMRVIEQRLFGTLQASDADCDAIASDVRWLSTLALDDLYRPWGWLRQWPPARAKARRQALQRLHRQLDRPCPLLALPGLSADEQRDNRLTMFLAGHDTTARALTWWCLLMAHHPAALARAQAELDAQDAAGPAADGAVPALPWLDASLKEALRLYPTVPVLPLRRLQAPVALGPWTLPAGCLVRIAPWVLQRDARHWPEPQAFRPERFLPGAPAVPPGAWMPFGAGPRACIGRALAMQEMAGVARALLRQVTPRPLPGAVLPAPEFKVVLRPPVAVALLLAERRPAAR